MGSMSGNPSLMPLAQEELFRHGMPARCRSRFLSIAYACWN